MGEILGSFFLTLTWALNGHAAEVRAAQMGQPGGVWSIAASLMCMIFAVGDVSGGLFNPALTLSLALRYLKTGDGLEGYGMYREMLADPSPPPEAKVQGRPCKEIPKYMLAQILGGAGGSAMTL